MINSAKGEPASTKRVMFASSCFWCMVPPFESLDGVISVAAGYTGGPKPHPTYEDVCSGRSGHREVVEVAYDGDALDYFTLLETFLPRALTTPSTPMAGLPSKGEQYKTAIYYTDESEKAAAQVALATLARQMPNAAPSRSIFCRRRLFMVQREYPPELPPQRPANESSITAAGGRAALRRYGKTRTDMQWRLMAALFLTHRIAAGRGRRYRRYPACTHVRRRRSSPDRCRARSTEHARPSRNDRWAVAGSVFRNRHSRLIAMAAVDAGLVCAASLRAIRSFDFRTTAEAMRERPSPELQEGGGVLAAWLRPYLPTLAFLPTTFAP